MVLDASAIVAILSREPGSDVFKRAADGAKPPLIASPLVLFEAAVALARAN